MESLIDLKNQPALHLTTMLQIGMYEEKLQPLKPQPDNTGNLRPERFDESGTSSLDLRSAHQVQNLCQDRRHKAEGGAEDPGNVQGRIIRVM